MRSSNSILGGRQTLRGAAAVLLGAVALAGCGQKGDLYLPSDAVAPQRTSLPQTLRPGAAASAPQPIDKPATGTASPVRAP